jgi:hypothetical protein
MSTESGPSSRVRASDAEREEYASAVREAVGEGRLTLDEGDERLARIYAARYRDELRPIVTDLPRDHDERREFARGGPRHHPGRWSDGHRHHPMSRGRYQPSARGFVRHVGFVALIATILITIWAATGAHFFWPAIPLAFLAFSLIRHGAWLRWSRHQSPERSRA